MPIAAPRARRSFRIGADPGGADRRPALRRPEPAIIIETAFARIHSLYEFLAQPAAGLAIATGVLILAALAYPWKRWLCYATAALGLAALAGASRGYFQIRQAALRNIPRGALVDIGGYRMHLIAEGDARGGPALVWLSGGHGPGLALHHLHQTFRGEIRSILVDRPGAGSSDTGPFPRTTAREAEEVRTALANAGEAGPFVFIGHS